MIRWALGCCPSPRWPLCSSTQPLKTLRRRRTSAAATNVKKLVSAGRTVTQSVGGKDNKAPDWAATRFFLIIKHVQSMEKWQHVRNRKAPSLPNADCAGSHRWDPWVWCGQSLKSMMCFFKHTIQCLWYSTKEKSQVPLGCFYPSIQSIVFFFFLVKSEDSLKEKIKAEWTQSICMHRGGEAQLCCSQPFKTTEWKHQWPPADTKPRRVSARWGDTLLQESVYIHAAL